jgi:RNA polymerase sigma-70 factor (ECF subfamily)
LSTTPADRPDTQELIGHARRGDARARQGLLARYRDRLRRRVAGRIDRRLSARVDPSDVVQESLADAARELSDYLNRAPLPLGGWLWQFARDRLVELHRKHLRADRRSVARESPWPTEEGCATLPDGGTNPVGRLERDDLRERVRGALARLPRADREVLVLRLIEQLPTREVAARLGIGEGAVRTRQVRALGRLRDLLESEGVRP